VKELEERKNGYYKGWSRPTRRQTPSGRPTNCYRSCGGRGLRLGSRRVEKTPGGLERLRLSEYFDATADAGSVRPKPDPEIFLAASKAWASGHVDCVGSSRRAGRNRGHFDERA
jgi:beta-phosphoglucomutase-like phosphatase (HAD superfamily)